MLAMLGLTMAGAGVMKSQSAQKKQQELAQANAVAQAQLVTAKADQAQTASVNWAENQAMQASAKQSVVTQVSQSQANKDFWVAYADWQRKAILAEQKRKLIQILSQNTPFIDEIKSRIQTLLSQYGIRLSGISLNQVKVAGLSHIYRFLSNFTTPGQNPTNFGNKNQGEYFTYWNQRIGLAPVLPDIPEEINSILESQNISLIEGLRRGLASEMLSHLDGFFSFDYIFAFNNDNPLPISTQNYRLTQMNDYAGRAYLTIYAVEQTLGYMPSYTQLLGMLWAYEGGAIANTPSNENNSILLGDDLQMAIAHQLNSACLTERVDECKVDHFLFMLGFYWQGYYNFQPSTLIRHIDNETAMLRGEAIIEESLRQFTDEDPWHYGPTSRLESQATRTYPHMDFGDGPETGIWVSSGSRKFDPITGEFFNTTQTSD
jgi:hypothetical protein